MATSRLRVGQVHQETILDTTLGPAYGVLSAAGVAMGAYHGYRRNNSVGLAVGWAVLGGLFPFITIPVSLAQGFGKKA